jgi:hypothetical protein
MGGIVTIEPTHEQVMKARKRRTKKSAEYMDKEIEVVVAMEKVQQKLAKQNAEYVFVQAQAIKERLDEEGIEAFVPDAEVALLMAIKGYSVAKGFYNRTADGDMELKRMETCYVQPNYQAAVLFLKTFAAEKYGKMAEVANNIYNVVSTQVSDADLARMSRIAGSLLDTGIKQIESTVTNSQDLLPEHTDGADG